MDKLLREHRKSLGGVDVISFGDDAAVERLRDTTCVDVPMQLNWTWNYDSEVEELRSLYEKGKVNQWNAETDLDWDVHCSRDEWVIEPEASMLNNVLVAMGADEETRRAAAFDETNFILSQLLHGEQAALQLCGQLTNICDKMDEKSYAASQVIDEARHVEAFSKFMQRKMGGIHPVGPTLKTLLDLLLEADTARKKTLGMQTLFEGMAVGIMNVMREEARNSLLIDMIRRVELDEARHAAFGVLMMRRVVAEASEEERNELEDWAFTILEALNANHQLDMLRLLGPRYGIDPEGVVEFTVQMPNFGELNSPIYMHTVIPNLRNLGLITDRTREQWIDAGMLYPGTVGAN
ncbi:diiron oxygenase [Myxococcota bacterium]|nr:diiron oxygenase [Myxococcota bacterium]